MGYRSEVTLALSWEANSKLIKKSLKIKDFLTNSDMLVNIANPNFIIIYQWDWIKWYDNPIIEEIEDFLRKESNPNDYLLITIGEALDDMNIEGILQTNKLRVLRKVVIG